MSVEARGTGDDVTAQLSYGVATLGTQAGLDSVETVKRDREEGQRDAPSKLVPKIAATSRNRILTNINIIINTKIFYINLRRV